MHRWLGDAGTVICTLQMHTIHLLIFCPLMCSLSPMCNTRLSIRFMKSAKMFIGSCRLDYDITWQQQTHNKCPLNHHFCLCRSAFFCCLSPHPVVLKHPSCHLGFKGSDVDGCCDCSISRVLEDRLGVCCVGCLWDAFGVCPPPLSLHRSGR